MVLQLLELVLQMAAKAIYLMDEDPYECVAGVDGIVIAQAWGARVDQGQTILMVAEKVE